MTIPTFITRKNDICTQVTIEKLEEIKKKYPHLPLIEDFNAERREAYYRLP